MTNSGSFEQKNNVEKLDTWKMALHQAASLSGYHFKHGDGYEYQFINRIVELGTSQIEIEIIFMDCPLFEEVKVEWDGDAFKKMKNLRTLTIRSGLFSKELAKIIACGWPAEGWLLSKENKDAEKELHEDGNTIFYLPVTKIPEWFECQTWGPPISFWFRNKFPAIVICLDMEPVGEYCSLEDEDSFTRGMIVLTMDADKGGLKGFGNK
ncbi:hypothetical protein JHK87_045298 [Glycine soja]|nr:hypothetical protein JHK87_045298 [Glycine soja]